MAPRIRQPSAKAKAILASNQPSTEDTAPAKAKSRGRKPSASNAKGKGKGAKSRKKGVEVEEEEESAEQPEDGGEDEGFFCVCLGGDDGTPMIQCEGCKNWYHFRCIGLDEDGAASILAYFCETCELAGIGKTLREETNPNATSQPPSPPSSSNGDDSVEDPDVRLSSREQSPSSASEKMSDAASDFEAKASSSKRKREARTSTRSKKRTRRGPRPEGLSEDEDEADIVEDGTYEGGDVDPEQVASTNPANRRAKLMKLAATRRQSDTPEASKAPRSTQRSSGSPAAASTTLAKPKPPRRVSGRQASPGGKETSPGASSAATEKTRRLASQQLAKTLEAIFTEGKAEESTVPTTDRSVGFAEDVEREVFERFSETESSGQKAAKQKYLAKIRSLNYNLKSNGAFRVRVLSGELDSSAIVNVTPEDLLTPEQRELTENIRKQSLKDSIKHVIEVPKAKITRKGEEMIEAFSAIHELERAGVAKEESEARAVAESKEKEDREESDARSPTTRSYSIPPAGIEQSPTSEGISGLGLRYTSPPEMGSILRTHGTSVPGQSDSRHRQPSGSVVIKAEDLGLDGGSDNQDQTPTSVISPSLASPPTAEPDKDMPGPLRSAGSGRSGQTRRTSSSRPQGSFNIDSVWGSLQPTSPSSPHGNPDVARLQKEDDDMDLSGTPEYSPREPDESETAGMEHDDAALPDDYDPFAVIEGGGNDEDDFDTILHDDGGTKEQTARSVTPATEPPNKLAASQPLAAIPLPPISSLPHAWSGDVIMPDEGAYPAVAVQVGGRELGISPAVWSQILPERIIIEGRIPVKASTEYLVQNRFAASRELVIIALIPDESGPSPARPDKPRRDEAIARHDHLINYFVHKDRHGVGGVPEVIRKIVKDLYIVPLRKADPLPEFVELLDNHRVPDLGERDRDMFLGVLVLQKGLAPSVRPQPIQSPPLSGPPQHQPTDPMHPAFPSTAGSPFLLPNFFAQPIIPPAPTHDLSGLDTNALRGLLTAPGVLPSLVHAHPNAGPSLVRNPNLFPLLTSDPAILQSLAGNASLLQMLLGSSTMAQPAPYSPPPNDPAPSWQSWPPASSPPDPAPRSGPYVHPDRLALAGGAAPGDVHGQHSSGQGRDYGPRGDDRNSGRGRGRGGHRGGWRGGRARR